MNLRNSEKCVSCRTIPYRYIVRTETKLGTEKENKICVVCLENTNLNAVKSIRVIDTDITHNGVFFSG